jgi:hypothetical protein
MTWAYYSPSPSCTGSWNPPPPRPGWFNKFTWGQRKRESGCGSPLVRCSGDSGNLVKEISIHLVKVSQLLVPSDYFGSASSKLRNFGREFSTPKSPSAPRYSLADCPQTSCDLLHSCVMVSLLSAIRSVNVMTFRWELSSPLGLPWHGHLMKICDHLESW